MSEPFIGEVRLVGFNFNPVGWHLCDGSLLPISEFNTLYALIGTTYGGDGQNTFGLPDLRGRVPIHQGTGLGLSTYTIGQQGGATSVTLNVSQLPAHTHPVAANSGAGTANSAVNNYFAQTPNVNALAATGSSVSMVSVVGPSGGSQPHENQQPFLTVNYIIALYGIYPSRS